MNDAGVLTEPALEQAVQACRENFGRPFVLVVEPVTKAWFDRQHRLEELGKTILAGERPHPRTWILEVLSKEQWQLEELMWAFPRPRSFLKALNKLLQACRSTQRRQTVANSSSPRHPHPKILHAPSRLAKSHQTLRRCRATQRGRKANPRSVVVASSSPYRRDGS